MTTKLLEKARTAGESNRGWSGSPTQLTSTEGVYRIPTESGHVAQIIEPDGTNQGWGACYLALPTSGTRRIHSPSSSTGA